VKSLREVVVQSLKKASQHNSQSMVAPRVVLWPDPERQWESILDQLQQAIPSLLCFGDYQPDKRQGPAIWLKCMVERSLPEANWADTDVPIIYMPGIAKKDFRNISEADLLLQPLMEYQYTGSMWLHENGREWTIAGFLQNEQDGMGLNVSQDNATKDALQASLAKTFNDKETFYNRTYIDSDILLSNVYPNIGLDILHWMSNGDKFLKSFPSDKQETFKSLCKSKFGFEPDYSNIKEIALKLGSRKNSWAQVWDYFANAPHKFPEIPKLLDLAFPGDLGTGMFSLPKDSWPRQNELEETQIRDALKKIETISLPKVNAYLKEVVSKHSDRRNTVWFELGQAPLVDAVEFLYKMSLQCSEAYPSDTVQSLIDYYTQSGYLGDYNMRRALAAVSTTLDKETVTKCIRYIYMPWLEKINIRFQEVYPKAEAVEFKAASGKIVLFVDALRYEVAKELVEFLQAKGYELTMKSGLTAIPTVTPTAKAFNSPIANEIDRNSQIKEFRPNTKSGKDLVTATFRGSLKDCGYEYVASPAKVDGATNSWLEIGTLDTKGHEEQANMVRRVPELFEEVHEHIQVLAEKGISEISIVTDHGWLLLPGGLPKTNISKDLIDTRWGRCATIKEGASVDLPHFSWTWNPSIFIAYAPGISFFKNNEEYAHGGISLQECVVPQIELKIKQIQSLEGTISEVNWNQLVCRIELNGAPDGCIVDIRTKREDPNSSVVLSESTKRVVRSGKARLMVDDSRQGDAAHVVLTSSTGIIIDDQLTTIGK
jgi:hypothetical protein